MSEKIKIGGISGVLHIALAIILTIISLLDSSITGNTLYWNILVFNAPVLIDFWNTWAKTPKEKMTGRLDNFCLYTIIGLLASVVLTILCVGIVFNIDIEKSFASKLIVCVSGFVLKLTFMLNPIGVLLDYFCSILTEERRRETNLENDAE